MYGVAGLAGHVLTPLGGLTPMATVTLFFDPAFRDGAFTANDPAVRAYALQKTMRAMDLGAELPPGSAEHVGESQRLAELHCVPFVALGERDDLQVGLAASGMDGVNQCGHLIARQTDALEANVPCAC